MIGLAKDRFFGWTALTGASVVLFLLLGGVLYSFGVFMPFVCNACGWSRGALSGASAMMMIVSMLAAPLAGWFVGKFGPRLAIAAGNSACAAGLFLMAVHSRLWQAYVAYGVLVGVGVCVGGMIPATTVANNWFVKKAPLAMSITMAAGGLGGLTLMPVLMSLITGVGWRSTYLVLAGVCLLTGVLIPALFIRNKPEDLGQVPDGVPGSREADPFPGQPGNEVASADFTVGEALKTGTFWLLTGFINTFMFLMGLIVTHQVAFLVDMGISSGSAAAVMGLFAAMSTVGTLAVGFLSLKVKVKLLASFSAALVSVGMVILLLTETLPLAFVYTSLLGLGMGAALVSSLSLLSAYFGRSHYARIMGISMVFSIVAVLGGAYGRLHL